MLSPTATLLPYGTWPSPLTANALAKGTLRLSSPLVTSSGDVYWLEGRPAEGGRTVLCRKQGDGAREDLTPAPFDVRSKVHEYGGAAFTVVGQLVYFVNASDQAIYRLSSGRPPEKVAEGSPRWRFAELLADPVRPRLVAVAERRAVAEAVPDNLIVAVHPERGEVEVLVEGADFYASPTVSPDGRRLAYLAWNHPHMPWDAAALYLADLDQEGSPAAAALVAGSSTASAQQPNFTEDGTLFFLLEREGYWNLHRWQPGGPPPRVVGPLAAELGVPMWGLGTRTWDFIDQQTALAAAVRGGVTELVRIDLATGTVSAVPSDVVSVGQLACGGGRAALLAGFADRSSGLVLLDEPGGERPRLSPLRESLAVGLDGAYVSRAQPITFPTTDGDVAHGFFYPPANPGAAGPTGALPPLVVFVHGGPTAATGASFSPLVQYFTTRGLAVLDVNYRGSSGYGRPYRDRLQDHWGIYDVDDCLAGARFLADGGKVDRRRMAIRGSSAGGYTVLAALVHPQGDLFGAGACLYGVSDLEALARDTHKFESRYLDGLVGKWPEQAEVYAARSPIHQADALRTPVIFFQGLDDKVVPPDQTRRLADALTGKGIAAPYHAFAGESHGFRREETLRAVYELELGFYGRMFGF